VSTLAGGQTLRSEGDTGTAGRVLLVIGSVLAVVAGALLVAAVNTGEPGLAVAGAIVGVIAVALLMAAVKELRKARRLDPGVLDVAAPTLYLSTATPCRFRRRVKRGSRTPRDLQARLVLREWVRYTVGTDTRTAIHDVSTTPVAITPVADVHGVAADLVLHLPAYPPSFDASHNKVQWRLVVDVTFDDDFSEDSVFALPVAPAVVVPAGGSGA
jgi:hypothetical protein